MSEIASDVRDVPSNTWDEFVDWAICRSRTRIRVWMVEWTAVWVGSERKYVWSDSNGVKELSSRSLNARSTRGVIRTETMGIHSHTAPVSNCAAKSDFVNGPPLTVFHHRLSKAFERWMGTNSKVGYESRINCPTPAVLSNIYPIQP